MGPLLDRSFVDNIPLHGFDSMSTNIVETGIVIKDIKDSPVDQCVGYQHISVQDQHGKWSTIGFEVLQYCIRADVDTRQLEDGSFYLPCFSTHRCIWADVQTRTGVLLHSEPVKEVQLPLPIPFDGAL